MKSLFRKTARQIQRVIVVLFLLQGLLFAGSCTPYEEYAYDPESDLYKMVVVLQAIGGGFGFADAHVFKSEPATGDAFFYARNGGSDHYLAYTLDMETFSTLQLESGSQYDYLIINDIYYDSARARFTGMFDTHNDATNSSTRHVMAFPETLDGLQTDIKRFELSSGEHLLSRNGLKENIFLPLADRHLLPYYNESTTTHSINEIFNDPPDSLGTAHSTLTGCTSLVEHQGVPLCLDQGASFYSSDGGVSFLSATWTTLSTTLAADVVDTGNTVVVLRYDSVIPAIYIDTVTTQVTGNIDNVQQFTHNVTSTTAGYFQQFFVVHNPNATTYNYLAFGMLDTGDYLYAGSADAVTWADLSGSIPPVLLDTNDAYPSIQVHGNHYYIVGGYDDNPIQRSADGVTWESVDTGALSDKIMGSL